MTFEQNINDNFRIAKEEIEQLKIANREYTAGTGISIDEVTGGNWGEATQVEELFYTDSEGYWNGIAYGDGKFVALNEKGRISTSTDGTTWNEGITVTNLGRNDWKSIVYGNNKFVAIGGKCSVSTSSNGTTWAQAVDDNNLAYANSDGYWSSVTFDGTKFIALHTLGYLSTSTDGITWSNASLDSSLAQYTGSDGYWTNVAYGNNVYVALNSQGHVSTSSNGTSWNSVTWPLPESYDESDGYWGPLIYDGSQFLALHSEGYTATSTDGATWTEPTLITNLGNRRWTNIVKGNSRLVALGFNSYVSVASLEPQTVISSIYNGTVKSVNNASPDSNGNVTLSMPTVNNGTLTIQQNGTTVRTFSANQSASTTANIIVPTKVSDLIDDTSTNPVAKAGTLTGLTATASELNVLDGITASTTELNYIGGVTSNIQTQLNGKQDALTGLTATASELNVLDGITASTTELNVLDGITASTTELNYIGGVTSNVQTQLDNKQDILTAGTGISIDEVECNWSEAVVKEGLEYRDSDGWKGLAYGANKFVALDKGGYISTSTNGETWTLAAEVSNLSTYSGYWQGISYGANKFVAINNDGFISTSTDGTTWTSSNQDPNLAQYIDSDGYWTSTAYDGTKFVAINSFGYVSTSTDGTTWSSATQDSNLEPYTDSNGYWSNIAYGNNKFVALNGFGYISTSSDGTNWNQVIDTLYDVYSIEGSSWEALAFDGSKFVAISTVGYVSTSIDGTTWTEPTQDSNLGNYDDWISVASNGSILIALGIGNYVSTMNVGSQTVISCTAQGTVTSVNNTLPDSNGNVSLTIPAAQVNSDWNASSGVAQILNKPTLATVATSGSYNDLSNKPTIPTVNNATLTIQKNGTTVKTFTANASSDVTANITVPTAISDLTDDTSTTPVAKAGTLTGLTSSVAELNILDGVTATASELNILDGATLSTTELNYVDGVTSSIQTQLDNKLAKKPDGTNNLLDSNNKINATYVPDVLPTQTSNSGKFLTTNGTTASWADAVTASSTTTFTNKTFNANGTGNSITNLETADFASGVIRTTVRAKSSASDSALASEKAIATALEGKQASGNYVSHTASTAVGSTTQGVYVDADGVATAMTYTLGKSVPSDAVFTDTVYTHPTTSGNKHIPSGGSSGKILKWSADGTATWETEYSYTHPTTAGNKHIPSGGSSNQVLVYSSSGTAAWGAVPSHTHSDYAASTHSHVGTEVTLTGYEKASSASAVAATDTVNTAIGKLEKAIDGKQASGNYVPTSRTVNSKALSSNITLAGGDIAITSYSKPSSTSALAATDTVNAALGKLEKALDGKQASGSYAAASHTHSEYSNKDTMRSTEYIVGTQTATTNAWTGVTEDATLYDGKNINYFLNQTSQATVTLNLTLAGGTTTGAKPVYLNGTSYVGTHFPINSVLNLTYNSTKDAWFVTSFRDTNDINRTQNSNNIYAVAACTAGKLICGTKDGYRDIAAGVAFDIDYPIMYCGGAAAATKTCANNYYYFPGVNLQTTKASWTGTQWSTVYLVGTLSGKTFTIDSSVFTTTVPTTQDNKTYIPIGVLFNTYQCYFTSCKDIYSYRDGSFQRVGAKYVQGSATQPIYFDSNGQPQNTTYTLGKSVPSDAVFTDTVYTHPTTAGNKHIPSGGSSGQILKYSADGTATWANEYSYTHPTTSGNKHIPSGGSSGQFLKWSADGTATWAADNDTKNTAGSTDTSSKIFLVGATSQAANPQTYSHDTAFVDTDGALNSTTVTKGNSSTKVATTAFVATAIGDYLPKSGGTMTGALNFANNTWNKMGDDAYIGDHNVGGHVCIKPASSVHDNDGGITFFNSSDVSLVALKASSGTLTSSGALGVSNNAAKMQYNSTTEAIEFIFA